jgi:hypothetical protein
MISKTRKTKEGRVVKMTKGSVEEMIRCRRIYATWNAGKILRSHSQNDPWVPAIDFDSIFVCSWPLSGCLQNWEEHYIQRRPTEPKLSPQRSHYPPIVQQTQSACKLRATAYFCVHRCIWNYQAHGYTLTRRCSIIALQANQNFLV